MPLESNMRIVVIVIFVVILLGATGYVRQRGGMFAPAASGQASPEGSAPAETAPGAAIASDPAHRVGIDSARASGGANDAEASAEARAKSDESSPSTFYQWVDERGSVHFAASLDEVPASWRSRAGRIELESASFTRTATSAVKPVRPRPIVEVASASRAHDVTVYTAPWCGWCRKTLAFLDERGVDYVNKDIEADPDFADELREKTGGTAIPLVEIDGNPIRGFDPRQMTALLD
jgi:glutaredoxin